MNEADIKFRCHSLADLMTEPKAKGEVLSVGAKTAVRKLAKQIVYGVRGNIKTKFMEKDEGLLTGYKGRPQGRIL